MSIPTFERPDHAMRAEVVRPRRADLAIGVLGTGGFVPPCIRTNEDVGAGCDVTPEWIVERTGVRERRVVGVGQAASDLAAKAVRTALDSARLDPAKLDLLVLATSTPDELGPATACRVQALLGAHRVVALDVSAACAGWLFGTRVAVDWLRAGTGEQYAAVVGVETYSPFIDRTDRATAILFGDGAGATVLGPVSDGVGFGRIHLGSDGNRAGDVLIPAGGSREPATQDTLRDGRHTIHMDGKAVRDFILDIFPRAAADALHSAGLSADDIDLIVAHQPNPVLLRKACVDAGFDADRLIVIGDLVGNIGAGSVPYALAHVERTGRARPGDRILIVTFGAGVTWGSTILTWHRGGGED
jgi:3-oxoacyl-(acyl-carrier-protein) synthase III